MPHSAFRAATSPAVKPTHSIHRRQELDLPMYPTDQRLLVFKNSSPPIIKRKSYSESNSIRFLASFFFCIFIKKKALTCQCKIFCQAQSNRINS
uniref:Uncharacterized protein n=1 Tax=Pyxicephalus adspersus TaxID=30357 RepID=A0AAV3B2Z8_PYXAD|nr:TPA: hypothetical protein GDO54_000227 [Pyxicephalus adspersus]